MPNRFVIRASLMYAAALFVGPERGQTQEETPGTATPTVQASVKRSSDPLPPGCSLEETVQILTAFLDAFNRGDAAALSGFFPDQGVYPFAEMRGFQWYSVTDIEGHFVTYDPAELPVYFAARHEQHERLHLLELEVATGWHPGVGIVYRLSREADDTPLHEARGKGAISCDDRKIFVWSMGQNMRDPALRERRATPEP